MVAYTADQYHSLAKPSHWGVAVVVSLVWPLGAVTEFLKDDVKTTFYRCHKSLDRLLRHDSTLGRMLWEPLIESSRIAFASQKLRYKAHGAAPGPFPGQAVQRRSWAFGAKLFSQREKSRGFARAWTASWLATVQ